MSKHRDLVQELNIFKEHLLILKQAKLDFLIMQHVNIEILKENQNLRKELKEQTAITKTWLNSFNKVNQRINEQIPTQKKIILGVDGLTKVPFNFRQKDLVFVKSLVDDTKVSIRGVERPWLSKATADESSVCSTPLPPLKKLDGVEPVSGPKTIKSILMSKSTFKAEALKGVIINEPSSAPAKVRLAKRLTNDSYDDLFDYLQQFKKLVNASRAKKLEKSHDPLALVAHTGSSSRTSSPYYVIHPSLVVDYDDDYQGDTIQNNSIDPLTSAMILLARDRVNIQSKNFGNDGRNTRHSYVQEEVTVSRNVQNDAGKIQRTLLTVSSGSVANAQCYNCSEKGHYASNCPKPRIRDSKYFME
uniref:Reverse transcriptase domain-containing protein n=1 Tax=Tanacetum cinerariifolium TaxID=118510 RepID=A0A699GGP8_TANCI|nr:reverse transcriptase domain-containing protein [Tanacetum cinerariifolium]